MYDCIFTRSCDGYIRQKHLEKILRSDIPEWCMPYILRLSSEYVVEIVALIYDSLKARDVQKIRDFCINNPKMVKRSYQRMTSYWNEFYRDRYPRFCDYIGKKLYSDCFLPRTNFEKMITWQVICEEERNVMGEVIEINMLSPEKETLGKVINFIYEYSGCSKDSIEIKVMDNWQYEGERKLSDESQLYDLIDTKIIRIQGPCYLGFAGVTSEKIGNNYQFDVWMNPNPADEFDNAEFESFKKAAVKLIESMRVLVAFIGKEMMIDYTNGIDRAVKSATGADIVIIPDKT